MSEVPLHSQDSFQNMQSRPLTPNMVNLMALDGLVLHSVLTQSGVGAIMTAARRCSVRTPSRIVRTMRTSLFRGIVGVRGLSLDLGT